MLEGDNAIKVLDGVIRSSTTTVDAIVELTRLINIWKMAFPNWQDAYGFADLFFIETESEAIATIERLRSVP